MVKILFLAANPQGTSLLQLDEEARCITDSIRRSEGREEIELLTSWAVRADDLLQVLNEHKPDIVHFSGHGNSNEELIVVQESGQPRLLGTDAIRFLFRTLKDNVRVVVFNACFTNKHAEVLTEVIDCAIGMKKEIGDIAAIKFAASFYRAIGFRRSVQEAFDQGKAALLLEGIPEDTTPELFCRVGITASEIVPVPKKRIQWIPTLRRKSELTPSSNGTVQLVDATWSHQELGGRFSNQKKTSPLKRAIIPANLPAIDLKLKNVGNKAVFLNAVMVSVLEARIDPTPYIVGRLSTNSQGHMSIHLENRGWGKARDATFTPLPEHITKHLSPPFDSFTWRGDIDDAVTLEVPASSIRFDTLDDVRHIGSRHGDSGWMEISGQDFHGEQIKGRLTYKDEHGASHEKDMHYMRDWSLRITNRGFDIEYEDRFSRTHKSSSYTYDLELFPDRGSYDSKHSISQKIAPRDVDRFQIEFSSRVSAFYKLQIAIEVDGCDKCVVPPMSVHIINHREQQIPRKSNGDVLHKVPTAF